MGFLLEDLDRVIFSKRDYNKVKIKIVDGKITLKNIPINLKEIEKPTRDFYTIKFIKNIIFLFKNNFDHRYDTCKATTKKETFEYIINDIKKKTKIYNQELLVLLFNYPNDLIIRPSWRYEYVKEQLFKNEISFIDTIEVLNNSLNQETKIMNFYGKDLHYNKLGFQQVINKIK